VPVDTESDRERREERLPQRIRFLGHATLLIDLGYVRILTDPLLRHRVSGLVWRHPRPRTELDHRVDAVLISHMHQDHLDVPSLRRLGHEVPLLVPRRAGRFMARRGFGNVHELLPGQAVAISESAATGDPAGIHQAVRPGEVRVRATHADHIGFRPPFGPFGGSLGFVIEGGGRRIYFAGDTDLFSEMAELGPIDVAILPVSGWGPTLGRGHMNAFRAAQSLQLIRPKIAIPMHWGTFAPFGMHYRSWRYLVRPPLEFREQAALLAPDVDVRVLEPGESLDLVEAPTDPHPTLTTLPRSPLDSGVARPWGPSIPTALGGGGQGGGLPPTHGDRP
jgi:L-ascorbate metabolism protein UlaG (beta-lactamase superfamily)